MVQELKMKYNLDYLVQKNAIQENALSRISHELFNNVGQILSLVKINISRLKEHEGNPFLVQVNELVGKSISDIRWLAQSLMAERIVLQSLRESIQHELDAWLRFDEIQTVFTVKGKPEDLSSLEKMIVFRTIQETRVLLEKRSVVQVLLWYQRQGICIRLETLPDGGQAPPVQRKVPNHIFKSLVAWGGTLQISIRRNNLRRIQLHLPYQ